MTKRTTFTSITPLPSTISREMALRFLHDHTGMIDLNPLVIERHRVDPPDYAGSDEKGCAWYSITDKIEYIPGAGDWASGTTTYCAAFHDMPWGVQTHSYAAMGLEIRGKWSVGGSLPGEPHEPQELGIGAPETGLYLREDVDYTCNVLMAGFVKKTLKKSHATLVDALKDKAERMGGGGEAALADGKDQRGRATAVQSQSSRPTSSSLQRLQPQQQQLDGHHHDRSSSQPDANAQRQPSPQPPQYQAYPGQQQPSSSYAQASHERLLYEQNPARYQAYQPPPPQVHEAP